MKASTSEFRANLAKYLRAVQAGQVVVINDRDEPVAKLVPISRRPQESQELSVQEPAAGAPSLGDVSVRKVRYRGRSSTLLLREDRARR